MSSCCGEDRLDNVVSVSVVTVLSSQKHCFFAPFVLSGIHGFADTVRVSEQYIAGMQQNGTLLVRCFREEPDHRAAALQAKPFEAAACRFPEQHGWIVSGVDVVELARGRVEDAKEEGRVAIDGRGFILRNVPQEFARLRVTGWPEAVTRPRLPQNPACGFPALGSSDVDSQYGDSLL